MSNHLLKMARIAAATMLINAGALSPQSTIRCALIVLRVRPSASMCIQAKRSFASWRAQLNTKSRDAAS